MAVSSVNQQILEELQKLTDLVEATHREAQRARELAATAVSEAADTTRELAQIKRVAIEARDHAEYARLAVQR